MIGPPASDLKMVADAQARVDAAIARLSDSDVRRGSLLPGWTVGHVLTHLARNADSHRRRAKAAARGIVVEQYEGGYAARAADIDLGAGRPADELIQDVRASALALDHTWRTLPDSAWTGITNDVGGRRRPLHALPARRWQELEVHLVDLDVGPTVADWPDEFVADRLPVLRAGLDDRLPEGARPAVPSELDAREELAWLYGRLSRPGLPVLSPWS
jgi:maleylpyruvate isomerase